MSERLECLERQVEELEALGLMFPEDGAAHEPRFEVTTPRCLESVRFALEDRGKESLGSIVGCLGGKLASGKACLYLELPSDYPALSKLRYSLMLPSSIHDQVSGAVVAAAEESEVGDEGCLSLCGAFLSALEDAAADTEEEEDGEIAEPDVVAAASSVGASKLVFRAVDSAVGEVPIPENVREAFGLRESLRLYRCSDIVDRKSLFVGFAAQVEDEQEAKRLAQALRLDKKVARATHNMVAYRIVRSRDGVLVSDNDEDGESGAGSKMSHLLELLGCDDVFVLVSRWYGGVQLGPKRFAHINNSARAAIELCGAIPSAASSSSGKKGRR
jgi:hypothetical protein